MLDNFFLRYGHYNPNSVDAKAVKDEQKLKTEIAKYMSKSDDQRKIITGRLWGCSHSLSRAASLVLELPNTSTIAAFWQRINSKVEFYDVEIENRKTGDKWLVGWKYLPRPRDWLGDLLGPIKQAYEECLLMLRAGDKIIDYTI